MSAIPDKYSHKESEPRWEKFWGENKVYGWDRNATRDELFTVDTPPPTVSGSLHVGHVFSYTQTDLVVRYQRMKGKKIFYPMGWDDNGLPTERRVQNRYNIRCNPFLPYDTSWTPNADWKKDDKPVEVSRRNFIEACAKLTREDEAAFENLWRRLSLSVDWAETYATIDDHCRQISQNSFLDLVKKGYLYSAESPTMWDVDYQTALAQADLEDRTIRGAYHDIRFSIEEGGEFVISTTRPELIVSCIAVVAHPNDARFQGLFGKYAITPLFDARVPILPSEHADPEKGTGIMMVCTFGDIQDVQWWKSSRLPAKAAIGRDGKFIEIDFTSGAFLSKNPARATQYYSNLVGVRVEGVRKRVVEHLAAEGSGPDGNGRALVGEPKPIEHPVKFYEKGDRPVEFVTTRQWFIKILDYKTDLVKQGEKINWYPEHMRSRYTNWVEGLAHDWCISRQRYFGVPFPVWYRLDASGNPDYDAPIYAAAEKLPCDPLLETPPGFDESQRNQPNGFSGDPDVMDTWATSSVTPQIMSHWGLDGERHKKLFPMDVRPQGHDIIRTWAFYTILKAWMHEKEIPWKNVLLSGWILDPDRKKMSKSKGNTVTPQHLLEEHSADAVRYWSARARLGVDTAFDDKVFKIGLKLVTKLFNASRFVLLQLEGAIGSAPTPGVEKICEPLDLALVTSLSNLIEEATKSFESFDYARSLQITEEAFWDYCDNYVELVKTRAYAGKDENARTSAIATLGWSLKTFIRLFAPFLPYVTEEVWSYRFAGETGESSVHKALWPSTNEVSSVAGRVAASLLDVASAALGEVRTEKTRQQKSVGAPLKSLEIIGNAEDIASVKTIGGDLSGATRAELPTISFQPGNVVEGKRFHISLEFAPPA